MTIWLPRDLVLAIHDEQLARHGGAAGLRDAGLLRLAESRLERDVTEHVERDRDDDGPADDRLACAGRHNHPVPVLLDRGDWRLQRDVTGGLVEDRLKEADRAFGNRDIAAGRLLRAQKIVPAQGMPAEDGQRTGIVGIAAGESLALAHQHAMLIGRQVELCDALCDRHAVEAGDVVQRRERIVGQRHDPPGVSVVLRPSALDDRVMLLDIRRVHLAAHQTGGAHWGRQHHRRAAGGHDLGPGVRLEPVEEVAAALVGSSVPVGGPGAAADAITGLDDDGRFAGSTYLAGSGTAGEASPDHDDVMHGVSSPGRS